MNPLLDSNFLIKLNNDKNRTIYAHVISLNQYEHPIEQIEGVVTAGSVTIDGQSAVRRVCSLTLSAKNLNINNVYWGLTTKVKIEIGLQNNVEPKYDKIIWFPQGVFILTDFSSAQASKERIISHRFTFFIPFLLRFSAFKTPPSITLAAPQAKP